MIESEQMITVNGKPISAQEVAAEMQYHPAATRDAAYSKAAQALVVRELLQQEADRLQLTVKPEKRESEQEARLRQLIKQNVDTPEPGEVSCRTYYDNNRDKFNTQTLIEASHILLPALPDDLAARRAARQQADAIIAQLKDDPEQFKTLATNHSACSSAQQGGSLGQVTPGQTCEEFERQLFALPKGLSFTPVETRFGYHIVRIDQRVDGQSLDYPIVKVRIENYLSERVRRKAISHYIQHLLNSAELKGFEMAGDGSDLMQ